MANYTADQFIGKTLIALKNISAYNGHPKSNSVTMIIKGAIIGSVFSWVKDPDDAANVYWQFQKNGRIFFVRHNVNDVGLHPSESVDTVEDKKKKEREEKEKAEKGLIPYYIEKYGKPVLLLSTAALAVKAYAVYARNK